MTRRKFTRTLGESFWYTRQHGCVEDVGDDGTDFRRTAAGMPDTFDVSVRARPGRVREHARTSARMQRCGRIVTTDDRRRRWWKRFTAGRSRCAPLHMYFVDNLEFVHLCFRIENQSLQTQILCRVSIITPPERVGARARLVHAVGQTVAREYYKKYGNLSDSFKPYTHHNRPTVVVEYTRQRLRRRHGHPCTPCMGCKVYINLLTNP
jgi:hypothetical protein